MQPRLHFLELYMPNIHAAQPSSRLVNRGIFREGRQYRFRMFLIQIDEQLRLINGDTMNDQFMVAQQVQIMDIPYGEGGDMHGQTGSPLSADRILYRQTIRSKSDIFHNRRAAEEIEVYIAHRGICLGNIGKSLSYLLLRKMRSDDICAKECADN